MCIGGTVPLAAFTQAKSCDLAFIAAGVIYSFTDLFQFLVQNLKQNLRMGKM